MHSLTVLGYRPPVAKIIETIKTKHPDYSVSVQRPAKPLSPATVDVVVIDAGFSNEGPTNRSYGVVVSAFWNQKTTRKKMEILAEEIEEIVLSLQASVSSGVRYAESSGPEYGTVPDSDLEFVTVRFDILVAANKSLRVKITK